MSKARANPSVKALAEMFHRNGYVRKPSEKRRQKDAQAYRKGYEVRLVANSAEELRMIRRHLKAVEFAVGAPYVRGRQRIQPLYGKDAVTKFLSLVSRSVAKGTAKRQRAAETTSRRLPAT